MASIPETPARISVNPTVLRQARSGLNLDFDEAVALLNNLLRREDEEPVSTADVRSWEDGTQQPTLVQAETLAAAYLVPFVALFQTELPPPNMTDFRSGPGSRAVPLSYDTFEKFNRLSRFYLVAKHVSVGLGLIEDVAVPSVELREVRQAEDMEVIASRVRASLDISDDLQLSWESDEEALDAWRQRLEAVGIFVFALPIAVAECRGASMWEPGGPPAVLLNSADGTTAQLFTLMHEHAHLILAKQEGAINLCDPSVAARSREEQLANRFAAASLLPRPLVFRLLPDPVPSQNYSDWPQSERIRLRRSLRVSNAAIGIRLQQLGIVADAGLQTFWRRPSTFIPHGVSRPVWQRYRRYLGLHTTRLARRAIDLKIMSPTEISRILDIKVKDVEAMVG